MKMTLRFLNLIVNNMIEQDKLDTNKILEEEKEKNTGNSANSDRPWLFQKGQSGNPSGRPKGKTLKDYSREMLAAMTDEERQNFLKGIPKEIIWRLAEGNPHQSTDSHVKVEMPVPIIKIEK